MEEPRVLYLFMEEMLEEKDYVNAYEAAQKLDKHHDNDYFSKYVMAKQQVDIASRDTILKSYYKFKEFKNEEPNKGNKL